MNKIEELKINESDIISSPILNTMHNGSVLPTVFLPNYGEFGPVIHKLIKIVHFFNSPQKIVCCKKGDESFFPSADEFYYGWDDFVEEKYRWGFFTKRKLTGVGINEKHGYHKDKYVEEYNKIQSHFGESYNYIHLWKFNVDKVFEKYDHLFKFELYPKSINNIKVDVVISPRNRQSRSENNFLHWETIIEHLNKNGYTVGCVGSKDWSFNLKNSFVNSWDYNDCSSACIEMLKNCKLYIGLDTGPSHLAAFMSVPLIVFSDTNIKHYRTEVMKKITNNYFLDLGKSIKNIKIIIKTSLDFLNGTNKKD